MNTSGTPSPIVTADTKPWLKHYPSCVPAELDYPEIPAWGFLKRTVEEYPNRDAAIYYKQRLQYTDIWRQSRQTAEMLQRIGIKPGDRVGLMLPNVPEYLPALNGTWMAGGVAVAMSPLMAPTEVTALMKATDCKVVISLDLLAPLVIKGDYRPDHVVFTTLKDRLPGWQRLG